MTVKSLTIIRQVRRLWGHLSQKKKKDLLFLVVLMVVASFADMLTIGAVLPFLSVITSPEKIFVYGPAQPFIKFLQIQSAEDLLLPATLTFVAAALFAGLVRLALLWVQTQLSMTIGADFSVRVFERTLYQPYSLHVSRNSSEVLTGMRNAENLVYYIIQPVLTVLSAVVILVMVIITLVAIQPLIAITTFLGFGLIYFIIAFITKRRIANNSRVIKEHQTRVIKAIQEGLGGIRDVIIDGRQSTYSESYKNAFMPMQGALTSNQVVSASPRIGVETLGMVLIAGLAYLLGTASGVTSGVTNAIPVLGALALGAQRVLPLTQQIYNSHITLKGSEASIQNALDLLDQPMPAHALTRPVKPMAFQVGVTLKDISFRYDPNSSLVLRNLNLHIPKGGRVGIVGETGGGKSTLLDIVLGLLTPIEGALLIDDTPVNPHNAGAWQLNVSHVPQAVYLSDASIAENIAFGVGKEMIDLQRVKHAARQAQISQTIEGWSQGYETLVGERGVRLSGGQRQRIGIARALYKRACLIIFDEATSALDNETEAAVIQSLENLGRDITILIIAHRLTTLKNCDQIVKLANGRIKAVGSYEQLMRSSA